jgi:peroxin-16
MPLLKAYDRLLLDNLSAVQTVESGIRNITWLLPGRFADAEVASEGREWATTTGLRSNTESATG